LTLASKTEEMNFLNNINNLSKMILRVVLCFVLMALSSLSLYARTEAGANYTSHDLKVFFQFDKSFVNDAYMGNAATLSTLDSLIAAAGLDAIESVDVVSYSSPEGNYLYNLSLSKKRTESIHKLLLASYPELEGRITLDAQGEAWADLRNSIVNDSNFTEEIREKILSIIDGDQNPTEKEKSLKALPEYKRLYANYFKKFRYAEIRLRIANLPEIEVVDENIEISEPIVPEISEEVELPEVEVILPEQDSLFIDTLSVPVVQKVQAPGKKTIAAIKTNLLYDAVTALNVELEVPIGGRWSIMAEDVFPWWHIDNKYAFQMWEMGVEARFWFKPWDVNGTEKMRGWFVGAYGMSSMYDFQYDRAINYQGEYWSAGISAGYVMPIGKKKKLNLEFSISAGYLQTDYRHYFPADDYSKLIRDPYNMGTVSYFGPTKAKVSLIIPINFGKKGGAR